MTSPLWRQPDAPDIVRYKKIQCPHCGKPVDAAADADGGMTAAPQSGDFSICFGCTEVSVYEVTPMGVALRLPTVAEREQCLADNADAIARLRLFHRGQYRRPSS